MTEIIPVIIPKDFDEVKEKIKLVESYTDWFQLDIIDGTFVENDITWNNPKDLESFKTKLKLEVHLMIREPEKHVDKWIKSGVKRIIFHFEATRKWESIIKKIRKAGIEVGMAINPETSIDVVDQFIEDLDLVLIMTVNPGLSGQKFLKKSLDKIKKLREKYPDVDIQVDGGINLETIPEVIKAGANLLVIGSAIFKSKDIEKVIKELKAI